MNLPVTLGAEVWGSCLANRIMVAAAVIGTIAISLEVVRLFPLLLQCLNRSKASLDLEHQLSVVRSRNICALVCVLPFCLIMDRYDVYPLWLDLAPGWSVLGIFAVLVVYLLVRILMYFAVLSNSKMGKEAVLAMKRVPFSIFIPLTALALVTVAAMSVFGLDDSSVRAWLRWEICIGFFVSVLRSTQISARFCTFFSTILYLCALELIPLTVFVAGIVL